MSRFLRGLGRIPVTLVTLAVLLTAGAVTGTLFAPADPDDPIITTMEFGLPAIREGRVWTVFTGAITFRDPEFYLFVGAMLGVGLGLYERRVGSLRAATALIVTHTAGVVVPALLLWPLAGSSWRWASTLAGELDSGLSAGGFGVAAAATALLSPPWRARWRTLGTAFLVVQVLKSGLLWDLEHCTAWLTGLALGPRLARRAREHSHGRDRAEDRKLIALIVAGFALSIVVESVYPGIGGLVGPGPLDNVQERGIWLVLLELVIALLIAGALPRDQATAWWFAVAGTIAVVVNSLVNAGPQPRTGDAVCAGLVLFVLIWFRGCWPWRGDRQAWRSVGMLVVLVVVYAALTATAIWVMRGSFQPVPQLREIARQTGSRFTFTAGPLTPADSTGLGVLRVTGVAWAVIFIGWLVWALYSRNGRGRVSAADSAGRELAE